MQNAVAASSFVYNPVDYDFVFGDFQPGDQPSGAFTTTIDLGANFPFSNIIPFLASISFGDGATTDPVSYTNENPFPVGDVSTFMVETNAVGNISRWLIDLGDPFSAPELILADQISNPGTNQFASHADGSTGSNETSGTWSIAATTPAPALSTSLAGLLSVVLLGGLLIRNKSLKV